MKRKCSRITVAHSACVCPAPPPRTRYVSSCTRHPRTHPRPASKHALNRERGEGRREREGRDEVHGGEVEVEAVGGDAAEGG
eukprot:1841069-Rhodomonas_salina.1